MSMRPSAAERRSEAERRAKIDAWAKDMYARGFRIIGRQEHAALSDTVSLLALACRRFTTPFDQKALQEQIYAAYKQGKEILDKTVSESDFDDSLAPPDDNKVIYLKQG